LTENEKFFENISHKEHEGREEHKGEEVDFCPLSCCEAHKKKTALSDGFLYLLFTNS